MNPHNRANAPGRQGPPPGRGGGEGQGGNLPKVQYFEDGKLRPALLDSEAEQVGRALAEAGLQSAQLRRFYGDVLNLRRRFELHSTGLDPARCDAAFQDILPEFRMLRAKAFYANKRSEKILPRVMKQFVENHVKAVNSWKDFMAFCRHFEAVVAFHYAFAEKERN